MLSMVTNYINAIPEQIKKRSLPLTSGIVVVSTSLLNRFLSNAIFKCPRSSHESYGWSFLFCPGIVMAILTLLSSQRLSRTLTGVCRTDIDVPAKATGGKRKRTWKLIIRNLLIALSMAILAFLSWVIVTLLTTDTYVCIRLGYLDEKAKSDDEEKYRIKSRIAGILLLITCLVVTLVINLVVKCCYSDLPEKELLSMRRYDKIEAEAANKEFQFILETSADARGKSMVKRFLDCCKPQTSMQGIPKQKDEGAETEGNENDIFSRNEVERLRRFLAFRYPRLDGDEQLEYCRQKALPESFDVDQVDGRAVLAKRTGTEIAVALFDERSNSIVLYEENNVYHTKL